MSEMNKDNFEKSFEQQWQEAFEGAELTPSMDLWDNIENQLLQKPESAEVGKYNYFLFIAFFLILFGGIFIQKTNRVVAHKSQQISMSLPAPATIVQKNTNNNEIRVQKTINNLPAPNAQTKQPSMVSVGADVPMPQKPLPLVSSTPQAVDTSSSNLYRNLIKKATQGFIRKIQGTLKDQKHIQENAVEGLPILAMRPIEPSIAKAQPIDLQIQPAPSETIYDNKKFWVGFHRGVTVASPKLEIRYNQYLEDYAKIHQIGEAADLSNFFTEIQESSHYSIANQGDIRFGYHFSPRWQFIGGIQYRAEFLEQTTNAFFVNYYDYSRHSFLLDILEGNIQNPNFSQAIQNHPLYRPNETNTFTISQFNQQSSIHLTSRFEYIGIPMQVGYTIRPFKKLGFVVLGAAQVDKLIRSSTSSYELKDDVAIAYRLNTAMKLSTWSWQIGGGVQAEYKYNSRWAFTANSLLFQNIKPIKENKYVVVRPRGLQVNFGAKYMF